MTSTEITQPPHQLKFCSARSKRWTAIATDEIHGYRYCGRGANNAARGWRRRTNPSHGDRVAVTVHLDNILDAGLFDHRCRLLRSCRLGRLVTDCRAKLRCSRWHHCCTLSLRRAGWVVAKVKRFRRSGTTVGLRCRFDEIASKCRQSAARQHGRKESESKKAQQQQTNVFVRARLKSSTRNLTRFSTVPFGAYPQADQGECRGVRGTASTCIIKKTVQDRSTRSSVLSPIRP